MDPLPPVEAGYIRLVLFPEVETWHLTPGMIVGYCAVDLEKVGHIQIKRQKVYVDVHNSVSHDVRERLNEHGRCTVAENGVELLKWQFIRLAVGRNHGLNVGQLKKLMKRIEAGPLGKISINNTNTLIGIREDFVKHVIAELSSKRINGVASQIRLAHDRETGKKEAHFNFEKPSPNRERHTGKP